MKAESDLDLSRKYILSIVDIIILGKVYQESWETSIHGILEIKKKKKTN